jgi:diguanylate cyclase
MAVPTNEHEQSLAYAELALQQIRALRLPAFPRNFEIWYQYATGNNAELNRTINETLARKGSLDDADIDTVYRTYLSPSRMTDRIDAVGGRVLDEINQVLDMMDAAADSTTTYSESLADAGKELRVGSDDVVSLRGILQRLIDDAKRVEITNKKLEVRLSASRQEIERLQESLEEMRSESRIDPLTTLANRRFFETALGDAVAEAKENGEPLSLLMTDVDNFKAFNDKFGHLTGDQVLRLVAISVKQAVKERDIAARFGGEEFAVTLPKTALRQAIELADHIRNAVMAKELIKRSSGQRLGRVTMSIGVATLHANDTPGSLIERADACLYAAKRYGRNCVVAETDPKYCRVAVARRA